MSEHLRQAAEFSEDQITAAVEFWKPVRLSAELTDHPDDTKTRYVELCESLGITDPDARDRLQLKAVRRIQEEPLRVLPGVAVEAGLSVFPEDYFDRLLEERPEVREWAEALKDVPADAKARLLKAAYWLVADATTLAAVESHGDDIFKEGIRSGARLTTDLLARLTGALVEMPGANAEIVESFHKREQTLRKGTEE